MWPNIVTLRNSEKLGDTMRISRTANYGEGLQNTYRVSVITVITGPGNLAHGYGRWSDRSGLGCILYRVTCGWKHQPRSVGRTSRRRRDVQTGTHGSPFRVTAPAHRGSGRFLHSPQLSMPTRHHWRTRLYVALKIQNASLPTAPPPGIRSRGVVSS